MNDEFVKEWFQWAIDFVQMDISALTRKEKHSFFQKFVWFASEYLFNTSFDPFGKRTQFSQNQISEYESIALDIQNTLKEFLNVTAMHGSYPLPDLTVWIRPEGLWPPLPKNHRIYFQMHSAPKDMTPKNWAVLNLSRLTQGLEMHVVGECKECHRYFLNFSFREKLYCTPGCASRSIARSWREKLKKNPKKWRDYHKKQAKLTMMNYIERQARKGKIVRHRLRKKMVKKSVIKIDVTPA